MTLLMSAGGGVCSAALAQGWYAGGAIGAAVMEGVDEDDYDANLLSQQNILANTSIKEEDLAFKLYQGYQFNKHFALEGYYARLRKPLRYTSNVVSPPAAAGVRKDSVRIQGFGLDLVAMLPFPNGVALFGKAGVYHPKVIRTVSGFGGEERQSSDFSPSFGLGINIPYNRSIDVRAEWERKMDVGDKQITGEGEVDLWSAGLKFDL